MHVMNARAALLWRARQIARLDEHGASKERVRTYLRCCLVWAGVVATIAAAVTMGGCVKSSDQVMRDKWELDECVRRGYRGRMHLGGAPAGHGVYVPLHRYQGGMSRKEEAELCGACGGFYTTHDLVGSIMGAKGDCVIGPFYKGPRKK